jgi:hypothetical protein
VCGSLALRRELVKAGVRWLAVGLLDSAALVICWLFVEELETRLSYMRVCWF